VAAAPREHHDADDSDEYVEAAPLDRETEPVGADEDRSRRRSRAPRVEQPDEAEVAGSSSAETRRPIKNVPTWADAIALLVHRRPKQTSGWTPEASEAEPEEQPRESRARSSGPPRRRRRRS
jgi:hypothetical protein